MSDFFGRFGEQYPQDRRRPRSLDYILALSTVAGAVLIRGGLSPFVESRPLLVIPLLGVMLVAWLGGFWPAIVTLCTSLIAFLYLFVPSAFSFAVERLADLLELALLLFGGVGCALLGQAQRSARLRAQTALADSLRRQDELQAEIRLRAEAEAALRQRESDLTERARLSTFTARVSAVMVSVKNLDETLRECVEVIVHDLDAAIARIWSLGADADAPRLRASAGTSTYPDGPHSRAPVAAYKIHRIAQQRKPHLSNDFVNDPGVSDPEWARREGLRAFAGYPLIVQDRVVGVVVLYARHVLSASTFDALGTVADAIALRLQREQIEQDLRRSVERLRLVMEAMPILVWTADPTGEVLSFNRSWIEYTGLTLEQAQRGGWRQVIHPDDVDGLVANWAEAVRTGQPTSFEYRIRGQADGEYRWHQSNSVPLYAEDGTVVQWIGAASDVDVQKRQAEHLDGLVRKRTAKLLQEIEERTKAEKLVEAVMRELRRSNGELEQFAYVASHDLQEPLRKIQAFGDRLVAKFRDHLGEQGGDYIDRMKSSAARMQLLINDLLTFSRVSTRGQDFREVDLSAVARDVISDLETRILQTGGTVRVGDLPVVRADPLQMRQLLQNLIGNALKFAREGMPPAVEVAAAVDGDVYRLKVSDNGIGFEERYLDRIFQVFQRLHGRGTYEGTGVGLAICKKIAERHGGSITAQSTPGEGSTFTVTLPLNPPTEARTNDREEQ